MNSLNNLIKALMLAMVILGGTLFSMADPLPGDDPIIFELGRHDPTIAHGDYPRNPINPPSAYLDDHTLYINGEHPGYMLYLVDNSGEEPDLVYQVFVPANVGVVYLPATLTGTYELQLYEGGAYYFYSNITL